jgi:hypothetical protein
MSIKDGETEYGCDYIASIKSNSLTFEQILQILQTQVAMPELEINPDNKDEYIMHDGGSIEANNGDYRWVSVSRIKIIPKTHFDIMVKYICAFYELMPISEGFQFR